MAAMSEETAAALLRKLEALEQRDAEEAATLSTLLATVHRLATERASLPQPQPQPELRQEPQASSKLQTTSDSEPPRSLMSPEQFIVVATTLAAEGGPQGRRGACSKKQACRCRVDDSCPTIPSHAFDITEVLEAVAAVYQLSCQQLGSPRASRSMLSLSSLTHSGLPHPSSSCGV